MENSNFELKLERPLAFFDLETTGTNYLHDRIVEMSVVKLMPDNSREIKTRRFNPGKPIPAEASAIHGIYDEDVKNEPQFKAVSSSLLRYLDNCDLAGFNINKFDIPLLSEEFRRAGLEFKTQGRLIIDAQTIYHKLEPRNLSAAYRFYCGRELEGAHGAEADTLAVVDILAKQLEKHPELPRSVKELDEFCSYRDQSWIDSSGKFKWSGDSVIVGFGKNDGIPLKEIAEKNPDFLKWMINARFPDDAVKIAKNALLGIFPKK